MTTSLSPMTADQFIHLMEERFAANGLASVIGWQRSLSTFSTNEGSILNRFPAHMHMVIREALTKKEHELTEEYKMGIENAVVMYGIDRFCSELTPSLEKVCSVPLTSRQIAVLHPYAVNLCRVTHYPSQMRPS